MVLAVTVVTAVAYVVAALAAARRGRTHSTLSTVAFLAGLVVLALALRSRWGGYDDEVPWVHDAQHALVMGVAPALLALGAPLRLTLQVLPTGWARRVTGVLHTRPLRALCGPHSAVHVPLDYYGVMAAYLFTPWAGLVEGSTVAHVATHSVFLVCGLLFWVPVVGADVGGWHPDRRAALSLVAMGIPLYAAFALATGSWSLLVANEAGAVFGLVVVATCRRDAPARARRRGGRRAVPLRLSAQPLVSAGAAPR